MSMKQPLAPRTVDDTPVEPHDDESDPEYLAAVEAERNGTLHPDVAKLKALLDEGRNGPVIEVNQAFWDERRRVIERAVRGEKVP